MPITTTRGKAYGGTPFLLSTLTSDIFNSLSFDCFHCHTDTCERCREKESSLNTAEAVATTAVVCVVCSFTAGLLLGVLLTQCHGHCHRKGKRGQTEIPPVYEDIPLEKTPAIELKTNEAYGPIKK